MLNGCCRHVRGEIERSARSIALFLGFAVLLAIVPSAFSQEPVHGIAMHGRPALEPGFVHLPLADPDAPKGGSLAYGVIGTFDSLNPFILKSMRTTARGVIDPQIGNLIFESLLFRSRDEPFTMYAHLAESMRMPEDRSWIEFDLDPRARWSDGVPVTPEDVIFTYEIFTAQGRPPYNTRMKKIAAIEKTGDRSVRFTFNSESDREFPLIVGLTPIIPKHATDPATFADSTLKPPVGSGPYLIEKVEAGKSIRYRRNPDYWGKDLAVMRGLANFDTITIEYFGSSQAHFEAFKKGLIDIYFESEPAKWERDYDFPAAADGRVVKDAFEPGTPANMYGFVFNTRRPAFADRTVRQALATAFDFNAVNKNLFFGAYSRTASFWQGSRLSALGIAADAREREMLGKWPQAVAPEVLEGTYRPPESDGTGQDRKSLRAAFELLGKAGYKRNGASLVDADGKPLAFEILTRDDSEERLALAYKRSLASLGIDASIRSVDDAQYQRRLQDYDYDMILATYSASLSPGIEQTARWGSASRDIPGTFNYSGAADPAIDAAIEAMLDAVGEDEFVSSVRALDRLLISGHYVVPLFHLKQQWVARWKHIGHPPGTPLYGYYLPAWWDERAR
jgi:peptide/nickel transport system substrate-binding protein